MEILEKRTDSLCGDQVEFSAEENSEGCILSIAPRKNSLVRPPIVNIDQAVVIMCQLRNLISMPTFRPFLVLLEHKGIHPIVYISKLDLLEDMEDIHYYQGIYQELAMILSCQLRNSCPF